MSGTVREEIIRASIRRSEESESRNYRTDAGTTYAEFLEDAGENPAKFKVFVNGEALDDLDGEVRNGDVITLEPKKYNSGAAA